MIRRHASIALGGVLTLAAAIQLVPVRRANPPVTADVAAPAPIQTLLRRACYDCHSNETVWPWYSGIAPASWLVAHDVNDGRRALNFSTWSDYDRTTGAKKLKEAGDEIAEAEMPPWTYLLIHPEARLNGGERRQLQSWFAAQRDALARR